MKCDISREKLIDYVCGELPDGERAALAGHLSACKSCSREVAGLMETVTMLRTGEDETPPATDLSFVGSARAGLWRRLPDAVAENRRPLALGFALGAAAVLVALLLNLPPGDSGRGPAFAGGEGATGWDSVFVTRPELDAWRRQTYLDVARLIEASESRQQRRNQAALAGLIRDLEQQRRFDLQTVGRGLEAFQFSNEQRLRRTQEALHNLAQVSATRFAPANDPKQNHD